MVNSCSVEARKGPDCFCKVCLKWLARTCVVEWECPFKPRADDVQVDGPQHETMPLG